MVGALLADSSNRMLAGCRRSARGKTASSTTHAAGTHGAAVIRACGYAVTRGLFAAMEKMDRPDKALLCLQLSAVYHTVNALRAAWRRAHPQEAPALIRGRMRHTMQLSVPLARLYKQQFVWQGVCAEGELRRNFNRKAATYRRHA